MAARDHGTFSGEPVAVWLTEKAPDRRMRLSAEFWFVDPDEEKWVAPAGYVVDGASIPQALWTFVGSPYTGDYRRASIVHDMACDAAHGDPRARKKADRMFFHACMAGGCPWWEAVLLYVGVRIGAILASGRLKAWNEPDETSSYRARTTLSASDARMQADFRLVADHVREQGKTEDPKVVEDRTDSAFRELLGLRV